MEPSCYAAGVGGTKPNAAHALQQYLGINQNPIDRGTTEPAWDLTHPLSWHMSVWIRERFTPLIPVASERAVPAPHYL